MDRMARLIAKRRRRRKSIASVALPAGLALFGASVGANAENSIPDTSTGVAQSAPVQDVSGDKILIFAGGQLDFSDSGYAGATVPLPGAAIGRGFAVRGSAFGGDYSYDSYPARVHANFYGGQVEGVYQISGSGFWIDLAAGGRYVDTHLSPFDPFNRRHGSQGEFEVSVDGGGVRGPWRVDYYGSYGTRLDDYAARASLTHVVFGPYRAGGEVSFEGDPTYDLQRVGPFVGYAFDRHSEIQASFGYSHQSGEGDGGYLRVLYYHSF